MIHGPRTVRTREDYQMYWVENGRGVVNKKAENGVRDGMRRLAVTGAVCPSVKPDKLE